MIEDLSCEFRQLNDLRLNLSELIVLNSKGNLKSALILNSASLFIMAVSLLFIWADIRQNVQTYGFSYNVTTIIDNITLTEQIEVKDQFTFSMVLLAIVLINILNVVHFRGKLNELQEV